MSSVKIDVASSVTIVRYTTDSRHNNILNFYFLLKRLMLKTFLLNILSEVRGTYEWFFTQTPRGTEPRLKSVFGLPAPPHLVHGTYGYTGSRSKSYL